MFTSRRLSTPRICLAAITICVIMVGSLVLGMESADFEKSPAADCCQCPRTSQNVASGSPPPLFVPPSGSREGIYRFAAVAADNKECSKIGNYIMAVDGGSTVDAAIATILCVGIFNFQSSGIGGGHVLTLYNRSTGEVHTVIGREQAPSGATEDMFSPDKNVSSQYSGLAIGIPGDVRGLWEAYKFGGRLPWKHLFQPSINLCRHGYTVTYPLRYAITRFNELVGEFPPIFKTFLTNAATGNIYEVGDTMYRPRLARTLEIIADEGPDTFYTGSLSASIIDDITEAGGIITAEDLANFTALVRPPLVHVLRNNMTIYSPPLPSGGAVYQFILNLLDGYHFTKDSMSTVDRAIVTWHRISEAFKHAYALRTHLGDSDVESSRHYINEVVRSMTDRAYGDSRRQMIHDDVTFGDRYYRPLYRDDFDHGTTHLSVLGPNGDAVSITSTINTHFGSLIVGSRTGILFNNVMDDFSTRNYVNHYGVPASLLNFIKPWKRPQSSMSPSIIVRPDGQVEMVVGASGGTRIETSSAIATMGMLWFGWGIKEAVDHPRVHHQLYPQELQIEQTFPQVLVDGLTRLGHNISLDEDPNKSVVQAIRYLDGQIIANSDFRKEGAPDGY